MLYHQTDSGHVTQLNNQFDFVNTVMVKLLYNFKADIIIMRVVENYPRDNYNRELFQKEYEGFISYLNRTGNARIIITTVF